MMVLIYGNDQFCNCAWSSALQCLLHLVNLLLYSDCFYRPISDMKWRKLYLISSRKRKNDKKINCIDNICCLPKYNSTKLDIVLMINVFRSWPSYISNHIQQWKGLHLYLLRFVCKNMMPILQCWYFYFCAERKNVGPSKMFNTQVSHSMQVFACNFK